MPTFPLKLHLKHPWSRNRFQACFFSIALFLFLQSAGSTQPGRDVTRWENTIAQFEAENKVYQSKKNLVVFTGSSSIRRWSSLAEDFPTLEVVNRGFGGSEINDSNHFFHRFITPLSPRIIVLYAGENDLNRGRSPEQIRDDFIEFYSLAIDQIEEVHVIFVSMKPSPSRWHLASEMRKGNALIQEFIEATDRATYVNIFDPMLDENGEPDEELYVRDRLHMSSEGYRIWTRVIGDHLNSLSLFP